MTLALIVIAAISQAGFVRRSMELALEAAEAQEELQRRWGAVSCRNILLDGAAERFDALQQRYAADDALRWPAPSRIAVELSLRRGRYRCILADENTKLNVNQLYGSKREQLRPLLLDLTRDRIPIQLRPDQSKEAKARKHWFTSWGQIFKLPHAFQASDMQTILESTAEITCWGDGKMNIFRLSDRTLGRIATDVVNSQTASDLLDLRNDSDQEFIWPDALDRLDARRSEKLRLRRALSGESSCFSLWLEVQTPRRTEWHLWVDGDRAAASGGGRLSFHW